MHDIQKELPKNLYILKLHESGKKNMNFRVRMYIVQLPILHIGNNCSTKIMNNEEIEDLEKAYQPTIITAKISR